MIIFYENFKYRANSEFIEMAKFNSNVEFLFVLPKSLLNIGSLPLLANNLAKDLFGLFDF